MTVRELRIFLEGLDLNSKVMVACASGRETGEPAAPITVVPVLRGDYLQERQLPGVTKPGPKLAVLLIDERPDEPEPALAGSATPSPSSLSSDPVPFSPGP